MDDLWTAPGTTGGGLPPTWFLVLFFIVFAGVVVWVLYNRLNGRR